MENILVFKTNIGSQKKLREIKPVLNGISAIKDWNIDIEDIDNVLRIELNHAVNQQEITYPITELGFVCEDLEN